MSQGWSFSQALPDQVNGYTYLHQLYTAANPEYSGRATIPVLRDTATHTIVNNETAYERAFNQLFAALDWVEMRLASQPCLIGDMPTEADWRLFTTLVHFDAVYYSHFKCNRNQIGDFPHLSRYLRVLYQSPGIADTVNIDHIKRHYYMSHPHINPSRIVPLGPKLGFL